MIFLFTLQLNFPFSFLLLGKGSAVNIDIRIKEYPGIFRKMQELCDKSVEWKHKSTTNGHINGNNKLQSSLRAAEAFLGADIPLRKINQMLTFFKNI
ncbi:hypothetical protein C1645_765526 [Glomus cerebriforme]|uniref:Uncharacterized protein n=1 Tax=Glomus cerebriforme TaxID=658196 RepID=A0A397T2C5_9GLOM|nr:hypothetical protein C1645_765526 [Glomus cerebriforme]